VKKTINREFVNERIIMIDTVLCAREVSIVGLYAPTNDETTFEQKILGLNMRGSRENTKKKRTFYNG
jgi:ethanolamine utilization microcompartment shell protein EutL